MSFDAVTHPCGWRVSAAKEPEVVVEPATKEVVEQHLAKIAALLHAPRRPKVESEEAVKLRARVPMLRDVGHGDKCCCEVCWGLRDPRRGVVPLPDMPPVDASAQAGVGCDDGTREIAARYQHEQADLPPEKE